MSLMSLSNPCGKTSLTHIVQLFILLIKLGERDPEGMGFPCGLHWIHSLHCLCVRVNDLQDRR